MRLRSGILLADYASDPEESTANDKSKWVSIETDAGSRRIHKLSERSKRPPLIPKLPLQRSAVVTFDRIIKDELPPADIKLSDEQVGYVLLARRKKRLALMIKCAERWPEDFNKEGNLHPQRINTGGQFKCPDGQFIKPGYIQNQHLNGGLPTTGEMKAPKSAKEFDEDYKPTIDEATRNEAREDEIPVRTTRGLRPRDTSGRVINPDTKADKKPLPARITLETERSKDRKQSAIVIPSVKRENKEESEGYDVPETILKQIRRKFSATRVTPRIIRDKGEAEPAVTRRPIKRERQSEDEDEADRQPKPKRNHREHQYPRWHELGHMLVTNQFKYVATEEELAFMKRSVLEAQGLHGGSVLRLGMLTETVEGRAS